MKLRSSGHCVTDGAETGKPWKWQVAKAGIYIYIYTYIHASSLAGLGVHRSSLSEPMDATFWLKWSWTKIASKWSLEKENAAEVLRFHEVTLEMYIYIYN